ncbi:MAG: FAD:protein FMN transferase [Bacteroidales bacterium]|nr:FAD:protein FMN transferase [Bacteroidales bacterium]
MRKIGTILTLLVLLASCGSQPKKMMLQGFVQGSTYSITYYDEQGRNFQKEIDSIFHAVDLSVNLWVDSSVISKVNRNEEVELDEIFIDNFNIAQEAARLSDGSFDPTISPLVAAWGFGAKNGERITENGELIDSLLQLVDYRKVRIEEGKVVKENPAIMLDFNAIAQGYTTDLVSALLDSKSVDSYIVDIGGEVFARGTKPGGKRWVVGIEKPAADWDSERVVQQRVELQDKGIVTSGSYRKYVERDGKRYSHCIDPSTGYPVEHNLLSATVIAENATWADALASICMVMGMERSLELINGMDGVEAYYIFVNENNELETFATDGFVLLDQ